MLAFYYENENEPTVWFVGYIFPTIDPKKKVDYLSLTGAELKLARQVFDAGAFGKSEDQRMIGEAARMCLDAILKNQEQNK